MENIMPSQVDTLTIYQRLKSANLEDSAAKEIAEVLKDVTEFNLATKTDIAVIEKDIWQVKDDLIKYIEQVRSDLTKEIVQLRSDLTKEIEQVRGDLTKEIEQVRGDLRKDIEYSRLESQKEIQTSKADMIKWVAGMLIAQAALIATLVKLL